MVCAYGSFCYRRLTERALFCYYKSSRSSGIFACSLRFVYIESERSTTDRKDLCFLDQAIATVVVIVQIAMAILGQAMQEAVRHVMALAINAVVKHQCPYCKPAVNTLLTFLAAGNVSQQGLRRTKSSFQVQLLTILRCGVKHTIYCYVADSVYRGFISLLSPAACHECVVKKEVHNANSSVQSIQHC